MKPLLRFAGRTAYWLGWPVWRLLLARSVRTRVLVLSDGAVLVIASYLGDGSWGLPGGGLHRGEEPADGATREVYEETGLQLSAADLTNMGVHRINKWGLSYPAHFFAAEVPRQPVRLQWLEVAEYRWMPLDEAMAYTRSPALRTGLRLWAGKTRPTDTI